MRHNLENLRVVINSRRSLPSPVAEEGRQHFGAIPPDGGVWSLPPGVYRINWSGKGWTREQKLTVRSGERVIYHLQAAEEGQVPHFEMDRRPEGEQ